MRARAALLAGANRHVCVQRLGMLSVSQRPSLFALHWTSWLQGSWIICTVDVCNRLYQIGGFDISMDNGHRSGM